MYLVELKKVNELLRILLLLNILLLGVECYAEEVLGPQKSTTSPEREDSLEFIDKYLEEVEQESYKSFITLRGLNKITAHVSTIKSKIGKGINFGNLEIIPKICWKSNPEDEPEDKALLDIYEMKPSGQKERIFYGWMFSSSPSISSLEHPLYDITLVECGD